MKTKLKKLLALTITLTSPIWIIPYMTVVAVAGMFVIAYAGFMELYEDMLELVGVKNE